MCPSYFSSIIYIITTYPTAQKAHLDNSPNVFAPKWQEREKFFQPEGGERWDVGEERKKWSHAP